MVLCKSNFLDKNSKFLSKNKRFENSNCFLKKLYFYKAPLILCLGKFIKILLKMLAVGWSREFKDGDNIHVSLKNNEIVWEKTN